MYNSLSHVAINNSPLFTSVKTDDLTIPNTQILILNTQDSVECVKTIKSILSTSKYPSYIHINIFELLPSSDTRSCHALLCLDEYYCRNITSRRMDTNKGISTSLYHLENMISNRKNDRCLKINPRAHLINEWDHMLMSIHRNEDDIVSTYPSINNSTSDSYLSACSAHMENVNDKPHVVFNYPIMIKTSTDSINLVEQTQTSLEFYYGYCSAFRKVPHDPSLWGVEPRFIPFIRTLKWFTHGYNFKTINTPFVYQTYDAPRIIRPLEVLPIRRLESFDKLLTQRKSDVGTIRSIKEYELYSKINFTTAVYDPNYLVQFSACN